VFADYYSIYAYRYNQASKSFSINRDIVGRLGEGWEGDMNGISVHFPYKDAAAIRKALGQFGY
jgi:hypothetical protein